MKNEYDEREKPIPSKKNKKKWCRGKVGVKHSPVPMKYVGWWGHTEPGWWNLVCDKCGKRLDLYYPVDLNSKFYEPPPDWVPTEEE